MINKGGVFLKKILGQLRSSVIPVTAGSLLFGASVNMFLLPLGIVMGGATGIATAANKLWGFPVGLGIIAVNLPLFIIAVKNLGLGGLIYSIIGTALTSVTADLLTFLPAASPDPLVCAILGGGIMGAGSGMLLSVGITTGGTDLAAYLIHKKRPSLSTGRMIIFFDVLIIVLSSAALKNFGGILYSAVCIASYSVVLDTVERSSRRARMILVISDKWKEIADAISKEIDRGVTMLSGRGYYTGCERQIIMCVTGKNQEFPLRMLVRRLDPEAFIVICEAADVAGNGFNG